MSKRYSIRGTMYGADEETEICQVDQNPEAVVEALKQNTLMVQTSNGKHRSRIQKYSNVRIVEASHAQG